MAETPTMPPMDKTRLYAELHRLKVEREDALAGSGPDSLTDVLVELVRFRGMTENEASSLLGITSQAVNKRLRGAASASEDWFTRRSNVTRHFERWTDEELLVQLRLLRSSNASRARGHRCRVLYAQMQEIVAELVRQGESSEAMAAGLGVSVTSVYRLRGWRT